MQRVGCVESDEVETYEVGHKRQRHGGKCRATQQKGDHWSHCS